MTNIELARSHLSAKCLSLLLLLPLSCRAATGASVSCSSSSTDTYWASIASPTWIFIHTADTVLSRELWLWQIKTTGTALWLYELESFSGFSNFGSSFKIFLTQKYLFQWWKKNSLYLVCVCTVYLPGAFYHFEAVFALQVAVQLPLGAINKFTFRTLDST